MPSGTLASLRPIRSSSRRSAAGQLPTHHDSMHRTRPPRAVKGRDRLCRHVTRTGTPGRTPLRAGCRVASSSPSPIAFRASATGRRQAEASDRGAATTSITVLPGHGLLENCRKTSRRTRCCSPPCVVKDLIEEVLATGDLRCLNWSPSTPPRPTRARAGQDIAGVQQDHRPDLYLDGRRGGARRRVEVDLPGERAGHDRHRRTC